MTHNHVTQYATPGDWPNARCLHPSAPRMELTGDPRSATYAEDVARRRWLCNLCPHLDACRTWALTSPDPAGNAVAGGMTPAERTKTRRGLL